MLSESGAGGCRNQAGTATQCCCDAEKPPSLLHSAPRGYLQGSASFPVLLLGLHTLLVLSAALGDRGAPGDRRLQEGSWCLLACLMLCLHVGCGTELLLVLLCHVFHQKAEFLVCPKAGQRVCSLPILLVGLLSPSPPVVSSIPDS